MPLSMKISEDDLPMLSEVAIQAIALTKDAHASNERFNDLIRQDPALASRVLHIANSPFYGGRVRAHTICDAVLRMGMTQLRNILVIAAAGELFDVEDPVIRALWDHALAVAEASERISQELDLRDTEDSFIGGLLHDIGKFMIYRQHPKPYAALIDEAEASGRRLVEIETEKLRYFTHTSIGGLVIHKWRLGDPIAEAARFHHRFELSDPGGLENRNMVAIVALANCFVKMNNSEEQCVNLSALAELPFTLQLKLAPERLRRLYLAVAPLCQPLDLPNALEA